MTFSGALEGNALKTRQLCVNAALGVGERNDKSTPVTFKAVNQRPTAVDEGGPNRFRLDSSSRASLLTSKNRGSKQQLHRGKLRESSCVKHNAVGAEYSFWLQRGASGKQIAQMPGSRQVMGDGR